MKHRRPHSSSLYLQPCHMLTKRGGLYWRSTACGPLLLVAFIPVLQRGNNNPPNPHQPIPDLELECIPKLVILLSDYIPGFRSVCPMCIPTFKCVYHMCISTFPSFIVLRAQFPSPSFPCGLKAPSNGETHLCHIQPWSNGNALGCRILGRKIVPGWTATAALPTLAAPGFETPTKRSAAACITIPLLPMLRPIVFPTAWSRV